LKPEAPWIKKCSFGIKFTQEIYFTDDDREPTPDDEKEYKKRKQRGGHKYAQSAKAGWIAPLLEMPTREPDYGEYDYEEEEEDGHDEEDL